jgi:hypothetical protein
MPADVEKLVIRLENVRYDEKLGSVIAELYTGKRLLGETVIVSTGHLRHDNTFYTEDALRQLAKELQETLSGKAVR